MKITKVWRDYQSTRAKIELKTGSEREGRMLAKDTVDGRYAVPNFFFLFLM
jgi:hypothetical protein